MSCFSPKFPSLFNNNEVLIEVLNLHLLDKILFFLQEYLPFKIGCLSKYEYLIAEDYGLLIREETITNNVASPVKFTE